MKRTNTRILGTPVVQTKGTDAAEETNARAFNWAKRTAIPTIDDYVVKPFEGALKQTVQTHAESVEGIEPGRLLTARHTVTHEFPGMTIDTHAYRHSSIGHEAVLTRTSRFLEDCMIDNDDGVVREFIRKTERGPHVSAAYVIESMARWRGENTKLYNKQEVCVVNPETGKKLPLDLTVGAMTVHLNLERFKRINNANAPAYHTAKGKRTQVAKFVKAFQQHIMGREGVDPADLEGQVEVDYELADGSAVRYLMFPKMTSLSYGKVADRLTLAKTKKPAASTGDLVIARDLGFGAYSVGGRSPMKVNTETGKDGLGYLTIERKGESVTFSVLDNGDKGVYVRASDVLQRIDKLREEHSAGKTELKVDYFPNGPDYLA